MRGSGSAHRLRPSLFERLAAADGGRTDRAWEREAVTASIVRNLHVALNSHAGGTQTRPDWGLPDFNDLALGMGRDAPGVARAIQRQIQAFEPRLRRVRVRHDPERERGMFMTACFRIDAELAFSQASIPVAIETRVRANGSIVVR